LSSTKAVLLRIRSTPARLGCAPPTPPSSSSGCRSRRWEISFSGFSHATAMQIRPSLRPMSPGLGKRPHGLSKDDDEDWSSNGDDSDGPRKRCPISASQVPLPIYPRFNRSSMWCNATRQGRDTSESQPLHALSSRAMSTYIHIHIGKQKRKIRVIATSDDLASARQCRHVSTAAINCLYGPSVHHPRCAAECDC
jgi:hypothetical protein